MDRGGGDQKVAKQTGQGGEAAKGDRGIPKPAQQDRSPFTPAKGGQAGDRGGANGSQAKGAARNDSPPPGARTERSGDTAVKAKGEDAATSRARGAAGNDSPPPGREGTDR